MRWKVTGHNQSTGSPWEVTILARDHGEAAAQARNLARGSVDVIAPCEVEPDLSARRYFLNDAFRILVPPLMLLALVVKAGEMAASKVRRMIIPE